MSVTTQEAPAQEPAGLWRLPGSALGRLDGVRLKAVGFVGLTSLTLNGIGVPCGSSFDCVTLQLSALGGREINQDSAQ